MNFMGNIGDVASTGLALLQNTTVLIITIILGVIIGLFGLKLARVWAAFVGFVIGIGVGGVIAALADLEGIAMVGALLGAALVLAILFCIFYKVGMFFYMIFIVSGTFLGVIQKESFVFIAVALVIGLLVAIISIKWFDPIVIIVTSAIGAIVAGSAVVALIRLGDLLPAVFGVPAVMFVIFLIVQFLLRPKRDDDEDEYEDDEIEEEPEDEEPKSRKEKRAEKKALKAEKKSAKKARKKKGKKDNGMDDDIINLDDIDDLSELDDPEGFDDYDDYEDEYAEDEAYEDELEEEEDYEEEDLGELDDDDDFTFV